VQVYIDLFVPLRESTCWKRTRSIGLGVERTTDLVIDASFVFLPHISIAPFTRRKRYSMLLISVAYKFSVSNFRLHTVVIILSNDLSFSYYLFIHIRTILIILFYISLYFLIKAKIFYKLSIHVNLIMNNNP
jgi:hypothetical protein